MASQSMYTSRGREARCDEHVGSTYVHKSTVAGRVEVQFLEMILHMGGP